jgi:hypothetical protein
VALMLIRALVIVLLVALWIVVARRALAQWRLQHLRPLVDDAAGSLAEAVVNGPDPTPPVGRSRRRAYRLAALELLPELRGASRLALAEVVERLGLTADAERTLRRSPRRLARRRAAHELVEVGRPGSAAALESGTRDRDEVVQLICVRGLVRLGELPPSSELVRILGGRAAADVPGQCIDAMLELVATAPDALRQIQRMASSRGARELAGAALAGTPPDLDRGNPLLSLWRPGDARPIGDA